MGLGLFRHIFPEPHFRRSLINPPCQLLGFQKGMGPYILIVVVYSPEKTIGTLAVVVVVVGHVSKQGCFGKR